MSKNSVALIKEISLKDKSDEMLLSSNNFEQNSGVKHKEEELKDSHPSFS